MSRAWPVIWRALSLSRRSPSAPTPAQADAPFARADPSLAIGLRAFSPPTDEAEQRGERDERAGAHRHLPACCPSRRPARPLLAPAGGHGGAGARLPRAGRSTTPALARLSAHHPHLQALRLRRRRLGRLRRPSGRRGEPVEAGVSPARRAQRAYFLALMADRPPAAAGRARRPPPQSQKRTEGAARQRVVGWVGYDGRRAAEESRWRRASRPPGARSASISLH